MRRGGDEIVIKHLHITGKAWAQYCDLNSGQKRGYLAEALKGITVRRMADDSVFFIVTFEATRYVFCTKHGHDEKHGNMALVTVQLSYDR